MREQEVEYQIDAATERKRPVRPTRRRKQDQQEEQADKIRGVEPKNAPGEEDGPTGSPRPAMTEVNAEAGNDEEYSDAAAAEAKHVGKRGEKYLEKDVMCGLRHCGDSLANRRGEMETNDRKNCHAAKAVQNGKMTVLPVHDAVCKAPRGSQPPDAVGAGRTIQD